MKLDALRKIATIFPAVVCLLTIPLLTSCATRALWDTPRYEEYFSSVSISEDNKKLAVAGEKYDYIFEAPDIIGKTLSAPFNKKIYVGFFKGLHISGDTVSGSIELQLSDVTDEEKTSALAMGYKKNMTVSNPMQGIRYSAWFHKFPISWKPITIPTLTATAYTITEEPSLLGNMFRILATPATLIFDAVTFPFIIIALKDGVL